MEVNNKKRGNRMLNKTEIILNQTTVNKDDAIKKCGELLCAAGYVTAEYTEGMMKRDNSFSTAIGNLIAIPHGEKEYAQYIKKTGLCVITYPDGIDWNGNTVKLVIGIAALGDEHLEILENIVEALEDEESVEELVAAADSDKITAIFTGGQK